MSRIRKLRHRVAPLVPDPLARRALEWRALARATFPDAEWPRDLRRAAGAVALYQRLARSRDAGTPPGRVSLASLRADLEAGPAVTAKAPLGWVFAEVDEDEPASLRMEPGGRAVYRLSAEPGTQFECRLHAEPGAGAPAATALRFVVAFADDAGRTLGHCERRLGGANAGTIAALSLALPHVAGPLTLELSLESVQEEDDDRAPAGVWVDPCLVDPGAQRSDSAHPGGSAFPSAHPPRASGRSAPGSTAPTGAPGQAGGPRFSFLMPVHDPNPVFLDRAIASVLRQTEPGWELCLFDDASTNPEVRELLVAHSELDGRVKLERSDEGLGIAAASNAALAMADGEFVLLIDHDDEIEPDAAAAITAALDEFPDADLLYTDEATIDHTNRWLGNFVKPAWSPEFFESNMYSCHLATVRRELVERVGGFRSEYDGSQDYDLVLRLSELTERIVHVPGVRYFWRFHPGSASSGAKPYAYLAAQQALEQHFERDRRPGTVTAMNLPGSYRRSVAPASDKVAIVLAVPGDHEDRDAISHCLAEMAETGAEVVCAAGGAAAAELCRAAADAAGSAAIVAQGPTGASRAELWDLAVSETDAELLAFLAGPVEAATSAWLDEMLTVAAIPGVAVVGSVGVSPDERIEHAGVAVAAGVPLVGDLDEELAFDDPERVSATQTCVRDVSATSGTVLISRNRLSELGDFADQGFDQLAEHDLCLRARAAGARVAVTPNARLRRISRRSVLATTSVPELFRFQRRWWSDRTDPYYHPEFCGQRASFRSPRRPEPSVRWRPPVTGDARPSVETTPRGLRDELADAFITGDGVEIGPLHSPLRVPQWASVRYVDRMPVTLLRRHYPELADLPLVEIDIMDDGEKLSSIEAESQDFVIANHLLEHTGDPISTIGNWLRVLRPGGVIYLAVPDKRYTFDIEREPTPLEHIIRDYEEGPETSRRQHFEEWARHVEGVPEERVAERADALETLDYSVHTHVFTERELIQMLLLCDERVGPIEIEAMRRNGLETLAVIRKPDPAGAPPEPARPYDELPVPS